MKSPAARSLLLALVAACGRDRPAPDHAAAPSSAPADSLAMMGHGAALNPVGPAPATLGGDVLVVPAAGGGARVTVTVRGAKPGATLTSAVHAGTCADDRGEVVPLAPLVAAMDGGGTGETAVQLPPRVLLDGAHFIQAADRDDPGHAAVLCADLAGR